MSESSSHRVRLRRLLDHSITRNVSECRFAFGGIDAASPVILGEERDEALLGVATLENLGLVLNPFERRLSPMRMLLARQRPATRAQATAGAPHAAGSITARSSP